MVPFGTNFPQKMLSLFHHNAKHHNNKPNNTKIARESFSYSYRKSSHKELVVLSTTFLLMRLRNAGRESIVAPYDVKGCLFLIPCSVYSIKYLNDD